jgi:cytochrome c oxidase accessory protein FixG
VSEVRVSKPPHQREPEDSGSLYAAREKIYPREIGGRFQSLRKLALIVLLGLFYGVAWLRWDGRQAVLFDLPARQFHVFGLTFWPQDFFFLALLLIIAALSLFFFTALAGRLWCGYACPQTVWTEAFLWVERSIEGDRARRMKLDARAWDLDKAWRKLAKHGIWVLLAAWTGYTFVGYFTPITELGPKLLDFDTGPWETFWVVFYGFATWGNAGFLREQVCIYMCPYARFQSAMFDQDTLVIAYDHGRGEPRGSRKRGADPRSQGLGDCIDCELCVQVCPTGIDIREGLQYECIACAACIDACDSVMDRMQYPRGLIRYTTQHAVDHQATHVLRPRTLVYTALLSTLVVSWIVGVSLRKPLAMDVLRDRNALYRVLADGSVENVYLLKVMNRSGAPRTYALTVEGLAGLRVETDHAISAQTGEVANVAARVIAPPDVAPGGHAIELELTELDGDGAQIEEEARFFAPSR